MSKHTPGPWLIEGRVVWAPNAHGTTRFQASVSPGFVGETGPRNDLISYDELEANIKLIAAARDLLAALKAMVGTFRPCNKPIGAPGSLARRQWEDECAANAKAEDAIRKAVS